MFKFVQTFVMAKRSSYLDLVLNPLNLLRTKRILHVNPTVIPQRKEPEQINLYVYDYDAEKLHQQKLAEAKDAFLYKNSASHRVARKFSGCSKLTQHAKTVLSSDLAA